MDAAKIRIIQQLTYNSCGYFFETARFFDETRHKGVFFEVFYHVLANFPIIYVCRFGKTLLMNMLRQYYDVRKDRGFEHAASTIQHIVETGGITAKLKDHFPSENITDPDNFISLLYYFGLLTIAGRHRDEIHFRIPNQVVREQMYGYLTQA